ncbi:NUDIX hydrolase [Actinotalea sp. K2]|uniref:NUDIX hydrolase n=1 Tax=Actinotalea sp. K2 TaxID=2939438 RepID=UPI00201702D7|nr:NUDIX hydrolase [Actinotalea sp. K2]MCL3862632.1 NUDIX hydrolase [Actinotalea sp. K2]
MPPRPSGLHPQPGDGWVECTCGRRHWGLHGAAGLLLFRADHQGRATDVVLQHRALWSDQGGTWGLPGGALAPGESPVQGALREAHEEAGIDPGALAVLSTHALDHGPWSYTTVLARSTGRQRPRPTDPESLAISWVRVAEVDDRPLLGAFADAWPSLRARIDGRTDEPSS